MRIVIVHGRAAEMEIPALMAAEWEAALWWGQERLGSGLAPGSLDVRLAFYGDLWRPDRLQPLPRIEPEVILETGDVVTTTCSYTNDTNKNITFGESTTNEMCFNFASYWPAGALSCGGGLGGGLLGGQVGHGTR